MIRRRLTSLTAFVICLAASGGQAAGQDDLDPQLLTVAESSDFTRTARYDEVVELLERIKAESSVMALTSMGTTHEGRSIPLAILADPPLSTPDEARRSGKPVIFVFANIHAGEVCGKEATLMLTREIATAADHPLLDDLILLIAPIYNADGNEKMAPDNRPGQDGPDEMGQRPNAQGLDLNRDYVKLEAPETRALVKLLTDWNPHLTVDCHTTNGSVHRMTLTYDTPLHPTTDPRITRFLRNDMLPEVRANLRDSTGYETFYYGNFNRAKTAWATYSGQARYGGSYQGLRGQMQILSEAYSYAPYKDRIIATREFVREILRYSASHAEEMIEIARDVRADIIKAGESPQPEDTIALRSTMAAFTRPAVIPGYEADNETPRDYTVVHLGRFEPTLSVPRPYAYIIEPGQDAVLDNLSAHGIEFESFSGPALVERRGVTQIRRPRRPFQGHHLNTVETRTVLETREFAEGATLVRTAQPLGTLLVYLLEPQCDDGLAAWNFFDDHLQEGYFFPVNRVRHPDDLQIEASGR